MLDLIACAVVKLLSGLLCRLPPPAAVWLGERAGLLAMRLQPRRAAIAARNLRAAFPGRFSPAEARRLIRACYRQLGAGAAELLRLPAIDRAYIDRYVTIEGRPHFDRAVSSGRPVILLTGHFGNWELSSIAAALHGYPIIALARAQQTLPRLYALLVSYRESKGCTVVHKGGAMKRLIAALERGQLVGIVGDQASRQGIPVDFFGRPALFATGPFELAYDKGAVILPAFIRRVRGPFHRLVVEPPITLARDRPRTEAVREGLERFAAALARHIAEEPGQWLWMHKRWKHTSARRVLVLSDGKLGHLKQSLVVVEAMRQVCPSLRHEVVEIRHRHRLARGLALLWSWWLPRGAGGARVLQAALEPACARQLLSRYADIVVSCGSSLAPANLLWASANGAKSVVLMNPDPLPLSRFHLVIAPRHDALPQRPNVLRTVGALTGRMPEQALRAAGARLSAHPRFRRSADIPEARPAIALFLGGDTAEYEVGPAFAGELLAQVQAACRAVGGSYLVTTSRRTPTPVERLLAERTEGDARCRLLLLAARDPLDGTMEGMLGASDVAVVTGESISMVSEACASGRRVLVVEPPLRSGRRGRITKHRRFLRQLGGEDLGRVVALPELARAVQEALAGPPPARALDNVSAIRAAVEKLL
jgi:KDO2-lipid IV(A) lauroyltransferase